MAFVNGSASGTRRPRTRGGARGAPRLGGYARGVPHDPSFGPRYFGTTSHFFVTSLAKRVSWTALPAGGREVRLPRHLDRAELSAGDPDDAHSGHPAPAPRVVMRSQSEAPCGVLVLAPGSHSPNRGAGGGHGNDAD